MMVIALSDHILLYPQILIDKICPIATIGKYPPNKSCCKEYILRLLFVEKLANSHSIKEVKLRMGTSDEIFVSLSLELSIDGTPH